MKKRLVSFLTALCLFWLTVPAFAEDQPADGYRFRFTVHLNEESLSPALREHARGYADLLDALMIEGTWAHSRSTSVFDLNMTITPVDPSASSIEFRIHGPEDYFFVTSPLLGEQQIVISNDSLLEFCGKAYEHLGIPLQYLALAYPYTWKSGFRTPMSDWDDMAAAADENGVISPEAVAQLVQNWENRLASNRAVEVITTSLGLDTGFDEAAQGLFTSIPSWFQTKVTGGEGITITRQGERETWTSACGEFVSILSSPDRSSLEISLPETDVGYVPSLVWQDTIALQQHSGRFLLQLLHPDPEEEDLLNLRASFAALPASWPANCDSLLNLSLTGGLFANIGFTAYLRGQENGDLTLEIRKPSLDTDPGPVMVTLTGNMIPLEGDVRVPDFIWDDFNHSTDILRTNDSTLKAFLPKILEPFAKGMLRFLFGIPTSACQVILDDLTDAGVLNLLLGE